MTHHWRYHIDWPFVAGVAACILIPTLWSMTGVDPRPAAAVIGFLAFVGLAMRFVETYVDHNGRAPTSTRVAVVLLMAFLFFGAIATAQLASRHTSYTFSTYPLLGLRIACLLYAVSFRRILGLDRRNPWVRRPA